MKHCNLCRVDVDSNVEFCPLCYNRLKEVSEKSTPEAFNITKENIKVKKSKHIALKILILLSIIVSCACVFINIVTKTSPWSVVIVLSVLYLWVFVYHSIISRDTPFKKVMLHLIVLGGLLTSTNIIFGGNDWLTNYVYPSLAMLVSVVLTIMILCHKKRQKIIFSFFTILVLLALVSIVFIVFNIDSFKILNAMNIVIQGLFVISYLLFSGKTIVTEAHRKFHV